MMNPLEQVFDYQGSVVRTLLIDGEPWFVARDVCEILEITNTTVAMERLDSDEVTKWNLGGLSGEANVVNEPGLYSLILGSRKPEARLFKRWIIHEVIPSLRKHGAYMMPDVVEQALQDPDMMIRILTNLKDERAKRSVAEQQVARLKPKAEFFDAVASSRDAIEIGHAAKVLGIRGLGRNKLFAVLRERGVLMKDNIPYQEYIDRGYFRTVEQKWTTPNGETKINIKTLVYQRGLQYIRRIVAGEEQSV